MNKKVKHRLEKRWWTFNDYLENLIERFFLTDIGMCLFFITIPIAFILKTMQWLLYLAGNWIIKAIPTAKSESEEYDEVFSRTMTIEEESIYE